MLSIHVETQLTFCTKSCKLTSINLFVNYLCLLKFYFCFWFLYTSLYFGVLGFSVLFVFCQKWKVTCTENSSAAMYHCGEEM